MGYVGLEAIFVWLEKLIQMWHQNLETCVIVILGQLDVLLKHRWQLSKQCFHRGDDVGTLVLAIFGKFDVSTR